ncbi:CpaD family pilus assembly protein [Brevundimonas sp. SORGH_AS_0993]|uniref:CpaD family pilus assembly protein n=1 Tax=Brevundimonas sp. SORGH_AS_0993 TaxID=3041794 RepID=UPI002783B258|nr:CpaD family pilus assembly protein [Brevundimonas sp. SORGH_AS_0993]MDQ1154525.1 pilus assembly protein CpaD [Brevundimonas sp. SORGH_AS_0993]
MTRTLIAALLTTGALTLGACVGGPASLGGEPPLTPTARYQLQVEPDLDRIALAVHDTGLSPNQRAALEALVGRWRAGADAALVVEAPAGEDPVALKAAYDVRNALANLGVPTERLQLVSYAAPDPRAPVLAGYQTVRAVVPQCGTAWGNLGRTGDNQSASNFGCAVTANLAAQIADPRDIQAPRAMTPASAARRTVVFDLYRAGKSTSADREQLVRDSVVSRAVN